MSFQKILLIVFGIILTGCTSQKKVVYLQDSSSTNASGKYPEFIMRINYHDILSIQVFTVNTEAFPGIASTVDKQVIDNRSAYEKGFVVDQGGTVELPLIGKVSLMGLTITEARDTLARRFSHFMDDPVVMIKKLSFKVTVLGEVNKPGLYYVPNEKITMLEALGMAGDLTYFGNRKEIKIIRHNADGYHEIIVDLTTKQPLNSEVAYLYPDDVMYIPPIKRRGVATISPSVGIITSILATITLIASVVLRQTY
jgi:polysaccharide biosynthesis/export protein